MRGCGKRGKLATVLVGLADLEALEKTPDATACRKAEAEGEHVSLEKLHS